MSGPWTNEEDEVLKKLYLNTDAEKIAKKLNRTKGAIWERAQRLGLKKYAWAKSKIWSKKKIIDEINKRSNKELKPTNVGSPLHGAGTRYFGSYRKALEAAGRNWKEIFSRKDDYWTKEKIIREIQGLKPSQLKYSSIKKIRGDLLKAGINYLGSWEKAVGAAGYDYSKIREREKWSKEKVLNRLKSMDKDSLSSHHMQKKHKALFNATLQYFGTYKKAVEAAGYDYDAIRRVQQWTPQKVLEQIKVMPKRDLQADVVAFKKRKEYRGLRDAARLYFGSWKKAVMRAGIDYYGEITKLKRGYWTKKIVLKKVRELPEEQLTASQAPGGLHSIAMKLYGSWDKALEAAGYNPEVIRLHHYRTDEEILKIIRKWGGKNLLLIRDSNFQALNPDIYGVARDRFRSWKAAVEAAGFNYDKIKGRPFGTKEVWKPWELVCRDICKHVYDNVRDHERLSGTMYRPDLQVDNRKIIDAKTTAWASGIDNDIKHYLPHCDQLEFWCLYGERPNYPNEKVKFKTFEEIKALVKEKAKRKAKKELLKRLQETYLYWEKLIA